MQGQVPCGTTLQGGVRVAVLRERLRHLGYNKATCLFLKVLLLQDPLFNLILSSLRESSIRLRM